MQGIFYRSDTRDPLDETDGLFHQGFNKREATFFDPSVRFPAGEDAAPDIIPASAVCFTKDFYAAPLFPVGDLTCASWVYVLNLKTDAIYNTQAVQYEYARTNTLLAGKSTADATDVLWPMFGQERAINAIAAGDIVGAVRVSRNFFDTGNVFGGGTFTCEMYLPNPHFTGGDGITKKVQDAMNHFVRGGALSMPTMSTGVVKSRGK